jgi:GxxExxY protein
MAVKTLKNNSKSKTLEELNKITDRIIGIAIEVHKNLKPGFVERIYEKALKYEFERNNICFECQKQIKVKYKDVELGFQQIDLLIEDEIIIETKVVNEINDIHIAQLLSYLKTMERRLGLILNFAKPTLEIKRVINGF